LLVKKGYDKMKYSIIIPCYNEEKNILELVKKVERLKRKYNIELVLVDNGSNDNTRSKIDFCVKEYNFIIPCYIDVNQGYGYGLIKGLEKANGDYVGWIHADLQVAPKEVFCFINFLEKRKGDKKYFLKGKRKNRNLYDQFFTAGMTFFELLLFQKYMYDIGAIPVLFHKDLLKSFEKPPYDFSIELYTYYIAKKNNYIIRRKPVILEKRRKGISSWNKGVFSKINQSIRIMKDSIKILKGEQVL